MWTKMQAVSALLTGIITYQVYYNILANQELGGKYQDINRVIYSWVSLIPSILLGIYTFKLLSAKIDNDMRLKLL